jgi:inner membrane transporter RhtA
MFSIQLSSALAVPLIASVGAAGTAWLRLTAGAIILLIVARPPLRSIRRRDLPALLGLGIASGLMSIAFLAAIDRIPLGTAVAVEFLGPLTVAALRSHSRRALAWPALALIGVVVLTEPWTGAIDPVGVGFALLAGIGWGSYILLTQRVGDRFSGITGLSITVPVAPSPLPSSASPKPPAISAPASSPPRSGSGCSTPSRPSPWRCSRYAA